jgi:hypothetical protein
MTTDTDTELFDAKPYEVPFPEIDDHPVDAIALTLRGALKLNRNDPTHVALIERLKLGRQVNLTCTATCTGKTNQIRTDNEDNTTLTHVVSLAIDWVDVPE